MLGVQGFRRSYCKGFRALALRFRGLGFRVFIARQQQASNPGIAVLDGEVKRSVGIFICDVGPVPLWDTAESDSHAVAQNSEPNLL